VGAGSITLEICMKKNDNTLVPATLATMRGIAYCDLRKKAFHRAARTFLTRLAAAIGLAKGDFEIRVNVAGRACSGEVILHADSVYVQVAEGFGETLSVLYRTCKGRKDCTGGTNRWATIKDLAANGDVRDRFLREMQDMVRAAARQVAA
jgi:hypothetical protein